MDTPIESRQQALVDVINARGETLCRDVMTAQPGATDVRVAVEFLPGDSARITLRVKGQDGFRMSYSTLVRLAEGTPIELYAHFDRTVRDRLLPNG
jgi:hypothetical protein